jgi:hypothetical protein
MHPDVLEEPLSAARPPQQASKDAWFNPSIAPASTRANAVVASVMQALEQHGRKRALRAQDRATLRKVMIPVIANLICHYLIGSPGDGIPVPRSNRDEALGGKGTRYRPFVFPRSLPKMLGTLCELGFAEQRIGEYSSIPKKSKRTTIRAGAKLFELVQAHKVSLEDFTSMKASVRL